MGWSKFEGNLPFLSFFPIYDLVFTQFYASPLSELINVLLLNGDFCVPFLFPLCLPEGILPFVPD